MRKKIHGVPRVSWQIKKADKESEQAAIQYLMRTLENLQKGNQIPKREVSKSERTHSAKIAFILLATGVRATQRAIETVFLKGCQITGNLLEKRFEHFHMFL